ncbi:tRNA lysidine(34) synthetase TilS [Pedobacter frigoris]|uniref:tRNA(Ile)-lysidine synthase n=1 Tax=Pedobacter frigoris TaxID=2571272 RepID=A0A4U1CPJ9_9SPHI|nr:tRNA lysidine(34) synthetase TilS [Pedobacter frigoris]TKC07354.1 tRNA lysidine(34) synthetase TilS [Pedobacter frigoris]
MLPLTDFKRFIQQHLLFAEDEKILLAVSGGKDSVLMAHLFKNCGYQFGIAHCNFGLRADESQRDESFVHLLAATLGVPFHVTHFKTKDYAAQQKVSTQMAARMLRYEWFEEIRRENGYTAIALAQHQDDAIETVLLNLTRGTGIAGLHGILPKRDQLVRPLLFLSRQDIDRLIISENIDFVEDSSNLTTNYARNKIRLKVIPQLKEINPNLEQTFEQNIQRFADTEMVIQQVVAGLRDELLIKHHQEIHISIAKVRSLKPQRLLLFELLRPYGFSESVTLEIFQSLDRQSGTSFYSPTHRITLDRKILILSESNTTTPQNVFIHGNEELVEVGRQKILMSYSGTPYFEKEKTKAFVDSDLLIYPLVIRSRQEGDKFVPIGMKTMKKLSDFFIDEKVPLIEKDQVPILINGNGDIIWVVGLRQDNRYKVTGQTKKVAIFELR